MNILMVVTSQKHLGNTGRETGLWLEEFTTPYYLFLDAGAEITLASPLGGQAPIDPHSAEEKAESTVRFMNDAAARQQLDTTLPLASVHADNFDAIFFPGGHGPLWDLAEDQRSIALIEAFARQEKVIGAVCHGPAVLKHPLTEAGLPLIAGKNVTGFSNQEEELAGLTQIVPFLVEDMLKANGAVYHCAQPWQNHVLVDGLLVTGQNPASSQATAAAVLKLLNQ